MTSTIGFDNSASFGKHIKTYIRISIFETYENNGYSKEFNIVMRDKEQLEKVMEFINQQQKLSDK